MQVNWNDLAEDLLIRFGDETQNAIPMLQAMQREQGYVPVPLIEAIAARSANIEANQLYGVATFYTQFTFKPKGKYTIKICVGTACHVKGSDKILSALYEKLSLNDKERTTTDMLFTVETVSCLGACVLAPVIVINDQVHGQVYSVKVNAIVDEILSKENHVPT
jgi:NADH-quinone oxidoreductase subunit E